MEIINRKEYVDTKCEGNHCFEGYAFDLIDEISKICKFKYEFRLVPKNAYGSYNAETKKWDGLVKELLDHVSVYHQPNHQENVQFEMISHHIEC